MRCKCHASGEARPLPPPPPTHPRICLCHNALVVRRDVVRVRSRELQGQALPLRRSDAREALTVDVGALRERGADGRGALLPLVHSLCGVRHGCVCSSLRLRRRLPRCLPLAVLPHLFKRQEAQLDCSLLPPEARSEKLLSESALRARGSGGGCGARASAHVALEDTRKGDASSGAGGAFPGRPLTTGGGFDSEQQSRGGTAFLGCNVRNGLVTERDAKVGKDSSQRQEVFKLGGRRASGIKCIKHPIAKRG